MWKIRQSDDFLKEGFEVRRWSNSFFNTTNTSIPEI